MYGIGGPICLIAFDLRFNFERENNIPYKLHLRLNISLFSSNFHLLCSGIYMFYALILATNKIGRAHV